MPYKRFHSSSHRGNTIDRFEKPIIKLMRDAAKAALDAEGIKYKVDPQGVIRITKQHLKDEKWVSYFSIDTYANSI